MHDPLLEHLIALAEDETPVEAEVTLIVGGMLVTGRVVSEDAYMAHHALTQAYAGGDAEDEAEADETVEADDADEEEDEAFDDEGAYVHLRDARLHAPGQAPAGNAGFYRIALGDVSGFSLVR